MLEPFDLREVHNSWHPLFTVHLNEINQILRTVDSQECTPARPNIFRAFHEPLESVKVLIVGQDPYPGIGIADGLAFSIQPSETKFPASLRNIFKEYSSDLELPGPTSGNLSPWSAQGVMLLNRSLTTSVGLRNAHSESGWLSFTESVAKTLAERDVVAVLWGSYAQHLQPLFSHHISTPHPSPLSAYRGFFGSKPFSKVNEILSIQGKPPIDWTL